MKLVRAYTRMSLSDIVQWMDAYLVKGDAIVELSNLEIANEFLQRASLLGVVEAEIKGNGEGTQPAEHPCREDLF